MFASALLEEVVAALERDRVTGPVAVLGDARLARRLTDAGREVVSAGSSAELDAEDGSLSAVVVGGIGRADDWEPRLLRITRGLRPGGLVLLVDRGRPHELGRRALCGGLSRVEQRPAGRLLVTSGRWQPW